MIKPSNGRVVLFNLSNSIPPNFASGGQPHAAIIAHVHSDKMVNLAVFDSNGVSHSCTSVDLIQDGDTKPENGWYCEWMPYQKGQAAKTEQAEAAALMPKSPYEENRYQALAFANSLEAPGEVIGRANAYLKFLEEATEPQQDPQPAVHPLRLLTDHVVNSANEELTIAVMDQPGAGGANHHYHISGFNTETNPSCPFQKRHGQPARHATILFQNGPIQSSGVNGITHEVLIAILIDRLRSFQAGPYACEENADALINLVNAQLALHSRTQRRQARGVEGTHTV
jgi:hypothetical protein